MSDRSFNLSMLLALSIVIIALVFGSWRIWQTSTWLKEHRAYIQQRDARWDPFIHHIEDHLIQQDQDYATIRKNQTVIMQMIEKLK